MRIKEAADRFEFCLQAALHAHEPTEVGTPNLLHQFLKQFAGLGGGFDAEVVFEKDLEIFEMLFNGAGLGLGR